MMPKLIAVAGVACLAVLTASWLGNGGRNGVSAETAAPADVDRPPIPPADVAYRGVAIQVASGWYEPMKTYEPMLEEIAALGANSVMFCLPGYMEHAESQAIYMDLRKVPPPEDLKAIIRRADGLGLKVVLMPIVLLRNPRGTEWRGVIDPPEWDEWWEEYTEFVVFFANIAREADAEALIVGSELVSTEKYTAKWRKLIGKVREHFHGGKLGYSANWDHYRPIEFWDDLDFIGMTSYYTLADRQNPSVEEIIRRWRPIRDEILAWQRTIGKPIVMTEVGWCSQEGAAMAPWNYYQNQTATPGGMEEQRRLYEAFIRVWSGVPELLGVIWWEWDRSTGGPGDYGYTPKNKPAEEVLRQWFTRHQVTTQPATPTTRPAAP